MRDIVMTDDAVLISFVMSLLNDAGIEAVILDQHLSALKGAFGLQPQRVAVAADRWAQARRILIEADLGKWVVDDDG